jgi:hypothetical protein
MRIDYNLTCEREVRPLVKAIAQELSSPYRYVWFTEDNVYYEVSGYRIDRHGVLTGFDNPQLVAKLQGNHRFIAHSEDYDSTVKTKYPPEPDLEASATIKPNSGGGLTIEIPLASLSPRALVNLHNLVLSRVSLIKKVLGVDELPIVQVDDVLQFPWIPYQESGFDPDKVTAYADFVEALCRTAKTQVRFSAKENVSTNDKYDFRILIQKIGLKGDKFKTTRKIFLSDLTGDGAFRDKENRRTGGTGARIGRPPRTHPRTDADAPQNATDE